MSEAPVLLVTGGSRGIGASVCRLAGAAGWQVAVNYVSNLAAAEAVVAEIRDAGGSAIPVQGDVGSELGLANIFSTIDGTFGQLDGLVNNDGKIMWTIDDGGYEQAQISGNNLFYSSTSGKTIAADKASGKILWSKENPAGIGTAPVLYRNVVIVGEMDGALRFLDMRNGDLLGDFAPGRGVTSRATVDPKKGEVYFMSHDANLFALKVSWRKHVRDWPWEN